MGCRQSGRYYYLNALGRPHAARGYVVRTEDLSKFVTYSLLVSLSFLFGAFAILFERTFSVQMFGHYGLVGAVIRAIIFSFMALVFIAATLILQRKFSPHGHDLGKFTLTRKQPLQPTFLVLCICFFGFVHMRYSFRDIPKIEEIARFISLIFVLLAFAVLADYVFRLAKSMHLNESLRA